MTTKKTYFKSSWLTDHVLAPWIVKSSTDHVFAPWIVKSPQYTQTYCKLFNFVFEFRNMGANSRAVP